MRSDNSGGRLFRKSIDKVESLVLDGKHSQAIAKLKKTLSSRRLSGENRNKALVLLADILNTMKRYNDSLTTLRRVVGTKPKTYYLVEGESFLALGENESAIRSSTHYDKQNSKGSLRRLKALWIKARALFNIKNYLKCICACDEIAKSDPLNDIQDSELTKSIRSELADIKMKAEKMRDDAREQLDIILYGRDFAWYRKARKSEFKGDYATAMEFYSNITSGTLKRAAESYSAHCLELLNKHKKALRAYTDFVKKTPYGLYTGETLWRMALLEYSRFSSKRSTTTTLKIVEKLDDWIATIRNKYEFDIALEGINDNLKKDVIDKMPKNYLEKNACGNLIPTKRYPADVINRLTSPWYLNKLRLRSTLLRAFLLGESGLKTEAAILYKKADDSGAGKLVADTGATSLLLKGLTLGSYALPPACAAKISSRKANLLAIAGFLYCSDDKKLSAGIADEFIESKERVRRNDLAAAMLLKAYCLIDARRWKDALPILKKLTVSRKFAKLPTRDRSLYLRACVLAKTNPKKAYPLFALAAKSRDKTLAPMALLAQALCAANWRNKKLASKTCSILKRKFPKSPYAAAGMTLRRAIRDCGKGRFAKTVDTQAGRAFVHRRTIVVPGTTPWDVSTSSLRSGDIIIYNLKFVGNGPCRIVTAVNVDLTRHEPQPSRKKGDRLIFLRAPVLFVEKLTCDFDDL